MSVAVAPIRIADYREFAPAPPLRPYVEVLWVHDVPYRSEMRLLADGRMGIVWRADAGAWVVGPKSSFFDHAPAGPFVAFGVRFRPGAGAAFLRVAGSELRDGHAALDAVDPLLAARLLPRLERARSQQEVIAGFNDELARRVHEPPVLDTVVAEAVRLLADSSVPVAEVADRVFVSERQLQRRFDERVGYSPKTLQRVLRFQHAVRLLRAGARPVQAAMSAGYADQAHLVRESRRLGGLTPGELVSRGH